MPTSWRSVSQGRATGDLLLRAVSTSIMEATRECDIVARSGGHEFAIALA
ncbi:diguanylate cyclase domain-containing protein [Actimicrobium sp. GrIS 1.19]